MVDGGPTGLLERSGGRGQRRAGGRGHDGGPGWVASPTRQAQLGLKVVLGGVYGGGSATDCHKKGRSARSRAVRRRLAVIFCFIDNAVLVASGKYVLVIGGVLGSLWCGEEERITLTFKLGSDGSFRR